MSRCGALAVGIVLALALAGPSVAQPCEEWGRTVQRGGDEGGIGGTGLSGESGIGGTGLSPEESGIGGTGLYGSITGFGSVCVNGVRVHTGASVSVEVNGRAAGPGDLGVGQMVWIQAQARDGGLHAQRIAAFSAVVGALSTLDAASAELLVAGRRVVLAPGAALLDAGGQPLDGLAALAPGDVLDVSGLRRPDGRIQATRIVRTARDAAPVHPPDLSELLARSPELRTLSLEGFVPVLGAMDRISVDGLPVDVSALAGELHALPPDTRLWLLAEVEGDGDVRAGRAVPRPEWNEPMPMPPEARPPGITPALGATDQPELFEAGDARGAGSSVGDAGDAGVAPTPAPEPVEDPVPLPAPGPIDRHEPTRSFEPSGDLQAVEPRR